MTSEGSWKSTLFSPSMLLDDGDLETIISGNLSFFNDSRIFFGCLLNMAENQIDSRIQHGNRAIQHNPSTSKETVRSCSSWINGWFCITYDWLYDIILKVIFDQTSNSFWCYAIHDNSSTNKKPNDDLNSRCGFQ